MKYRPKNRWRINETKSWFFEKIKKIDKLLANWTKIRSEEDQINKLEMKKEIWQQTQN
jgi:hypothetical protein